MGAYEPGAKTTADAGNESLEFDIAYRMSKLPLTF